MRRGRSAIVALGILLLGMLCSVITYVGLSLLGLVQLDNKEVLTFNVVDVEKEYDGTPLKADQYYLEQQLPDGYSVYVDYLGEITQVGTTLSSLQVQIFDETDKDVTSKYEVRINKGKITVQPRTISIEVEKERYYIEGNTIKVNLIERENSVTKLLPGHRIIAEIPEDFDIEQDNIQKLEITPKIVDSIGTNVTGLYEITFTKPSKLQKGASDITVSHMLYEKDYDGEPFAPKLQITGGVLEKNHKLSYKVITEAKDVGIYTNYKIEFVVYNELGVDVTGSYNITGQTTITVTINPRTIKVNPEVLEKGYDGEPFDKAPLSVLEGSLLEGHTATAVFNTPITDVGVMTTGYTVEIYDNEKNNVTNQYKINKKSDLVNLVVNRSKIELNILTTSKTFDGNNFGTLKQNDDYIILSGGLIKGHELKVSFKDDFSEVGKKQSQVIVEIVNERGADVSGIYDLIYPSTVLLEIKGTVVTLELDDIIKTYDGKDLTEIVASKLEIINARIYGEYGPKGLEGITFKEKILSMSDVCDEFVITSDMIEGVGPKKDQFSFEIVGKPVIEITQKEISLQIIDGDDTLIVRYNDQPVTITKNDIEVKERDGLVNNHTIVSVSSQSYELDFSGDDILLSVYNVEIYDNVNSRYVTHNYKINYDGVRNIEVLFDVIELEVKVDNIEVDWNLLFDYDEDPTANEVEDALNEYIKNEYTDKNKDLFVIINGNEVPATIKVDYIGDYSVLELSPYLEYEIDIDIGNFAFLKYNPHAYDYEDLNDYFEAYEVKRAYTGKIVLTNAKKQLTVSLPRIEAKYSDDIDYESLIQDAISQLVLPNDFYFDGYNISFENSMVDKEGTYVYSLNNFSISGIDEYNQHRYEIIINSGELVLTKETIEINLPSFTYEYTEDETASDKIVSAIDGLVFGEATINVLSIDGMENNLTPGTYSYTISEDSVDYEEEYYNLVINPGYVTVTKKTIEINLPSFTYEYTEDETASDKIVALIGGLEINDVTIMATDIGVLDYCPNPGTYSYTINENQDLYYDSTLIQVVINPGYVTITKKTIEINLPSFTYEYDADLDAEEKVVAAIDGLQINDEVSINVTSISNLNGVKNVGTYAYTISSNCVVCESSKYDVVIKSGVVTITKQNIYISVPSVVNSLSSLESNSIVIEDAINAILAVNDKDLVVYFETDYTVDELTPGTYSLTKYITFNVTDTTNYNLILVSVGTITVVA